MVEDFLYVLENYPNVNLEDKSDRELVAYALVNIMCEHHIVSYTDLESVKNDPNTPLINRYIQGTYIPGSIVKMISQIAILRYGSLEKEMIRLR